MDGQRALEDYGPAGALRHHYFHNDDQNTIGVVTDDTFNVANVFGGTGVWNAQNEGADVFGQPHFANGVADPGWGAGDVTRRRWINQDDLADAHLIDLNARVYDPLLGKFMSPDPVIADQDASQSWNAYAYAQNNPMSKEDPTGEQPVEVAVETCAESAVFSSFVASGLAGLGWLLGHSEDSSPRQPTPETLGHAGGPHFPTGFNPPGPSNLPNCQKSSGPGCTPSIIGNRSQPTPLAPPTKTPASPGLQGNNKGTQYESGNPDKKNVSGGAKHRVPQAKSGEKRGHKIKVRPSTAEKHERGETRRKQDQNRKESEDKNRPY